MILGPDGRVDFAPGRPSRQVRGIDPASAVEMSPLRRLLDVSLVAAGTGDRCGVWSLTTGSPVGPEIRHPCPIRDVWLSSSNRYDKPGSRVGV